MRGNSIAIFGEIDERKCEKVFEELEAVSTNSDEIIKVFLCSRGGYADCGFLLYDFLKPLGDRVQINCGGMVASAAITVLLSASLKNRRCLPNTRFMMHKPNPKVSGDAKVIKDKMIERYDQLLTKSLDCHVSKEQILKEGESNFFAEDAVKIGLVSSVVSNYEL